MRSYHTQLIIDAARKGLTGSGIRQELRFFQGTFAQPKVLATAAKEKGLPTRSVGPR